MAESVIKSKRLISERKILTLNFNNSVYVFDMLDISKTGYQPLGVVGWSVSTVGFIIDAAKVISPNSVQVEATYIPFTPTTVSLIVNIDILYESI